MKEGGKKRSGGNEKRKEKYKGIDEEEKKNEKVSECLEGKGHS